MTYVVTEACIKCKFMDCVEVCPVDCFYEGENMLVINPDECIDCGVCEPECPPEAIKADTESGLEKWLSVNAEYSRSWPNIATKGEAPADAKEFQGVPDRRLRPTSQRVEFAPLLDNSKINRNFNSLDVFSSVPCKFMICYQPLKSPLRASLPFPTAV